MSSDLEFDLLKRTINGTLYRPLPEMNRIECYACAHRCKIADGKSGICNIRYNIDGAPFLRRTRCGPRRPPRRARPPI